MNMKMGTRPSLTLAFVAIASMIFSLVPASPASAGQVTVAVEGTAYFAGGFLNCGPFPGRIEGTASGLHGTTPIFSVPVTADFNYCNLGLAGTANGTIAIAGHSCTYTWTVTGFDAVMEVGGCHTSGTGFLHFTLISPFHAVVVGHCCLDA